MMEQELERESISIDDLSASERFAFTLAIAPNVFWDGWRFPNGMAYRVQSLRHSDAGLKIMFGFQCVYAHWDGQWVRFSTHLVSREKLPANTVVIDHDGMCKHRYDQFFQDLLILNWVKEENNGVRG